ncbi:hypothetical protein [Nannocystis sp. SCPEA4]|uniref:hypothetical protein n=1 Tax=Nannocystis sp. SCPEA4 TaxID=2996787 RepID=UPI00226D65D4|nr:hypothetical protein [Nannocystis sp. SCPEA4]MCY1056700.1 hypothetical protein [Nannocystis sp. SCPEA4]
MVFLGGWGEADDESVVVGGSWGCGTGEDTDEDGAALFVVDGEVDEVVVVEVMVSGEADGDGEALVIAAGEADRSSVMGLRGGWGSGR